MTRERDWVPPGQRVSVLPEATPLLRDYVPPETVPREAMDTADLAAQRLIAMGKMSAADRLATNTIDFGDAPSETGPLPFVLQGAVASRGPHRSEVDPSTFDEEPTVTTARPAAAALVAEHVEENLRLHARVNELEARVRELEHERDHAPPWRDLRAANDNLSRLWAAALDVSESIIDPARVTPPVRQLRDVLKELEAYKARAGR